MNEPSIHTTIAEPGTVRLRDVDELSDAVSGALLELVQLQPGPLRATVTHQRAGELAIDEGSVNVALRVRGQLDPRRYSIGLFHPGAHATFNGHRVDASRLLCFMPGGELNGFFREQYGWTSLVIPSEWVEQMSRAWHRPKPLQMRTDCRSIRPESLKLAGLRAAVDSISRPAPPGTLRDRPGWLLADLRNALGETLSVLDSAPPGRTSHTVGHFNAARRAERHMRERMAEPLCIDGLCIDLHVSRRYLEYAFNDAFGISPSRYLRLLRLHEVRRRLRRPAAPTTVTEEALRLGFNHLSLFSLQYKKAFGESPSVTLLANTRRQDAAWPYPAHG